MWNSKIWKIGSFLLVFLFFPLLLSQGAETEYFLPQSPYFSELVNEFKEEREKKNWAKATAILKKINQWLKEEKKKHPGREYVYPQGKNRFVGARKYTFELFSSLPAKARELFATSGAQKLLKMGKKDYRLDSLEKIVDEYPFSPQAPRALELMSSLYLEEGNYLQALSALEKLTSHYSQNQLKPSLIKARKALCLIRLGEKKEARQILSKFKKPPKEIPWWSYLKEKSAPSQEREKKTYPGYALHTFPLPAGKIGQDLYGRAKKENSPPPQPYQGTHFGSTYYVQTSHQAMAIDLRQGQVKWRRSLSSKGKYLERPDFVSYRPAASGLGAFFTFKLQIPPKVTFEGKKKTEIKMKYPSQYRLVAYSKKGEKLWSSKDNKELDDLLEKAHSLSPPQTSSGKLFVTLTRIEKSFEVHLLCLDQKKGNILWRRLVSSALPSSPWGTSAISPAPLVRGNRVVLHTNLGAACAFEQTRGDLLWCYQYQTYPDGSRLAFLKRKWYWKAHPGISAGKAYLMAPTDSSYLYALSFDEGELLWKFPRDRMVRMEGYDDSLTFVASRNRILAIDANTGQVEWQKTIPAARGQWTLQGGSIYYPTGKKLYRIKASSGETQGIYQWEDSLREPGNLNFAGSYLVSTSLFQTTIYNSYQTALAELEKKKKSAFNSGKAYLALGKLHYRHGNYTAAIPALEKAQKRLTGSKTSTFGEGAKILSKAYLKRAKIARQKKKRQKAESLFQKALTYTTSDSKKYSILLELADLYRLLSQPKKELEVYRNILVNYGQKNYRLAPQRVVPVRLVAKRRIGEIISSQGRQLYKSYDAQAKARLQAALRSDTKQGLEEIIENYPNSQWCHLAYRKLADFYEKKGQFKLAVKTWNQYVREFPHSGDVPRALWNAARLNHRLSQYEAAMIGLIRLKKNYGHKNHPDTGQSYEKMAENILNRKVYRSVRPTPSVELPLRALWQVRTKIPTSSLQKDEPEFYDFKNLSPTTGLTYLVFEDRLECRESKTGLLRWQFLIDFGQEDLLPGGGRIGKFLIVPTGQQIVALDLDSGRLQWKFQIPKDKENALAHQINSVALGSKNCLVISQVGRAYCLSGKKGKKIWNYNLSTKAFSRPLFVAGKMVCFLNNPAEILAFDPSKGKIDFRHKIKYVDPRISQDPLFLGDDRLLFQLGGKFLVAFSIGGQKVLWKKKFSLWIHKVIPLVKRDQFLVSTRQWSTRVLCLNSKTGREEWKAESIDLVPDELQVDSQFMYIFSGSFRNFKITAVDLNRGQTKWSWKAPRGEKFKKLESDNEHVFIPYLRETPGKVYVLSKSSGATASIVQLRGRRILDIAFEQGVLMTLTNRGSFGYGKVKKSHLNSEIFSLSYKMKKDQASLLEKRTLAAYHFQLGEIDRALKLLEKSLLEGDLSRREKEVCYDQLDGYKEAYAEQLYIQGQPQYTARRSYHPIEIDGKMNDWWYRPGRITLEGPRHVWSVQKKFHQVSLWRGDQDLRGELYMAWDKGYFYFLLRVEDTVLRPYDSEKRIWKGDCLLMAIDFNGSGGDHYQRGDTVLSLALQVPKKKNRQQKKAEEKNRPEGKYFVKRSSDNSATLYEVALPWSLFKEGGANINPRNGPRPGTVFGINLVVTDDDGRAKEATKSLNLTPGLLLHRKKSKLWYHFVPNYFAKIKLKK